MTEQRPRLESIKRVALDIRPDERLQTATVGDVNADRKQVREILCNPDIFEKADGRLRVELDQNTYVARALGLATRDRAEQRRVTNPAGAVPLGERATWKRSLLDPCRRPPDADAEPRSSSFIHSSPAGSTRGSTDCLVKPGNDGWHRSVAARTLRRRARSLNSRCGIWRAMRMPARLPGPAAPTAPRKQLSISTGGIELSFGVAPQYFGQSPTGQRDLLPLFSQ